MVNFGIAFCDIYSEIPYGLCNGDIKSVAHFVMLFFKFFDDIYKISKFRLCVVLKEDAEQKANLGTEKKSSIEEVEESNVQGK